MAEAACTWLSITVGAFATVILMVVVVAYFTLLERKLLAATQRRRGPSMVGVWGLLQAFADALKLLFKGVSAVSGANYTIFVVGPVLLLALSLTMWVFIPLGGPTPLLTELNYSLAVVMLLSGINSYFVILSAISSHSRYSHLGGLRAIAQVVSYEVPMSVILLTVCAAGGSLNLVNFYQKSAPTGAIMLPAAIMLFVVLLAETNRAPFDLPEAEAELVAGYNLEYSSILFAYFFLAEYNNIVIGSMIMSIIFFNKITFLGCILFLALFVIIRAISPRYTYAQLMAMCWKTLIPASTFYFLLSLLTMALFGILPRAIYHSLDDDDDDTCWPDIPEVKYAVDYAFSYIGNNSTKVIFTFFVSALAFVSLLLLVNKVSSRILQNNKGSFSYECGFTPFSSPVCNFEPNYVSVALMFLVYDVDVLLMFPWALSCTYQSAASLASLLAFVGLMLCGLIVEVEDGVFDSF